MDDTDTSLLALDVGEKRIGVASCSLFSRLPRPLTTLIVSDTTWRDIIQLVEQHNAQAIVVGMPRDLKGKQTAQTMYSKTFAKKLRSHLTIPVYLQDEAVTSIQAEEELATRGKPYTKIDIDALAATYILEDYIHENQKIS